MLTANYAINRTDFCVIRGVQNEILFFVRDLDRNPAVTTGFSQVTISISDPPSATLLLSRNLTVVDAPSALYMLTILPSETADWQPGWLRWAITVTRSDGSTVMLWTDQNYGVDSMLEVKDGPDPTPAAPMVLDPSSFTVTDGWNVSSALPGAAQGGYQNGIQTFALYPDNFTGSIEFQASLMDQPQQDSDWFTVATTPYTGLNSLTTLTYQGNYLWMRVRLGTMGGSINQILYKN
jgi:hypothetical protein